MWIIRWKSSLRSKGWTSLGMRFQYYDNEFLYHSCLLPSYQLQSKCERMDRLRGAERSCSRSADLVEYVGVSLSSPILQRHTMHVVPNGSQGGLKLGVSRSSYRSIYCLHQIQISQHPSNACRLYVSHRSLSNLLHRQKSSRLAPQVPSPTLHLFFSRRSHKRYRESSSPKHNGPTTHLRLQQRMPLNTSINTQIVSFLLKSTVRTIRHSCSTVSDCQKKIEALPVTPSRHSHPNADQCVKILALSQSCYNTIKGGMKTG